MVKRKLDGAVDESLAIKRFINATWLYITWEKSGGLHLAKLGLTTGWQVDEIWVRLKILKACCRSKIFDFPLCLAKVLHCFSSFDAFLVLFSGKHTSTRLFYTVGNFTKPYDFISIPTIHCYHNKWYCSLHTKPLYWHFSLRICDCWWYLKISCLIFNLVYPLLWYLSYTRQMLTASWGEPEHNLQ